MQNIMHGHTIYFQSRKRVGNDLTGAALLGIQYDSKLRKRSLNSELRRREQVKIEEDNQKILSRLQNKTSQYNMNKSDEERLETEKILKNISRFPRNISVPRKRVRRSRISHCD